MKERILLSSWKSEAAEQRFREMEDALAAELMSDPPTTAVQVGTRLGPTHVNRWDGTGEPVVFLHGSTGTSLSWAPFAAQRRGRTMFAVDTIGDVGRSHQTAPVRSADDLADWLAEVLDGLGLERAHLVGTSYGGFLALNLAARHPERVRSLFVIESGALVEVRMGRFLAWGISSMVAALLPGPLRKVAARRLRMPALDQPRLLRFAFYGQRHHRSRMLRPPLLTDDQLRSINVPAHVVVAAHSEVFPPEEAAARARLLPNAQVEVIDDAGHAVVLTAEAHLIQELATFLAASETAVADE
jgi:pimeloyl-ACP methyl ester carboxylesterase